MGPKGVVMSGPFDEIRRILQAAKLDDSLLFLTHLLAVVRGEATDPELEGRFGRLRNRPPEFVVLFVAKWLLREASNFGPRIIDWNTYKRIQDLYFQLDDPIVNDPAWKDADPSGFFERMLGHQIPVQNRVRTRDIGLPLALFRDAGTPRKPGDYDLRSDLESELGMPIEEFIAMGYLCSAAALVNGIRGTLTPMYFAEAFRHGITWCTPQRWEPFLRRVSCTRDEFRAFCARPEYQVEAPSFRAFEFNPIRRFPVVDVGGQRLIAVAPELVTKRVTWGLFFDLFERHRTDFSRRFGDVFDRLVGDLLLSVCPRNLLWSDAEWKESLGRKPPKQLPKRGDWAYKGAEHTVLFECKALRPSLKLLHYGSNEAVEELRGRVVEALEQVVVQAHAMQSGKWRDAGLGPSSVVCVLLSYGRFYSVNLPFFRDRVRKSLSDRGYAVPPFVVLSVEEFDTVIRLVELGEPLDRVLLQASEDPGSADVLRRFAPALEGKLIASTFTHGRNVEFERKFVNVDEIIDGNKRAV